MIIKYKDITSIENLNKGLIKIKNNAFTDLDGKININFTEKKIETLHKLLKSQKFKPTPVKTVKISKNDGGIKLLGIASQNDKVVQAAILTQFEPVLENIFLNCSYGGRYHQNSHHALKNIKTKWQNVNWVINIEVQKYFDTINQDILLKILTSYCDQATYELIKKFLKCGYIDVYKHPNKLEKLEIKTFQNSLLSPIFSNLYFHFLDQFVVNKLFLKWNKSNELKFISEYRDSKNLKKSTKNLNADQLTEQDLSLSKELNYTNFRRMYYTRYFDSFLIGFTGSKSEAEELKNMVETFLLDTLKLKTNKINSYIKHSSDKNIKYLGFYIRYIFMDKIIKNYQTLNEDTNINKYTKLLKISQVELRIPVEPLLKCAVDKGYGTIRKDNSIRPTSCRKLTSIEDKKIVLKFSNLIKNLIDFYSPANKRSELWQIVSFYRKSCALTLADKHKLKTAAAVFKKYGPNLKVSDPIKKNETVLFYPTTLKTTGNFKLKKFNLSLSEKDF